MLFSSLDFVVFFVVVYAVYLVLQHRAQNLLLLAASYFFYGCWDWRFLSLIAFSTTVDYFCALGIDGSENAREKKRYVAISAAVNLGILFFFKYFGFFAESMSVLLGRVGVEADIRFLRFVLPVGISFYTFQTMSYTVDVYRGQLKPTRNFLDYALFVSFFPQLVAGPIERAKHLLPQVQLPRHITCKMVRDGAWLILLGYYKKVVLADNLAGFVDQVFNKPQEAQGLIIIIGAVAFAFQIYGDFSGYSDIARGLAKLMGFDIMLNFRMPYFACNPSDFWRRWHISLSTWLRDYLYIPLGGNRKGTLMTYRNLMLTMLLGGLWHGAAWNFVAWGLYHGILLVIHRLMQPVLVRVSESLPVKPAILRFVNGLVFFLFTCFGWFLFRVNHLGDMTVLLGNIFSPFTFNGKIALLSLACFALPLVLLDALQEVHDDMMVVKRWKAPVRLCCYAFVCASILLCGAVQQHAFIYFQF
ncbi:MAG: MBOAT family protein [Verrucomicrobia bacterium]|nr:MBOAT family protein [Verrucomicrobiota bacterium]